MRVITNEYRIKRGRRNGTVLFFLSLAVLTGGLLFTNLLVLDTSLMLFVPCIIMPIGLLTTLASVRLTNQWVRTPRPEDALIEGLVGINKRSSLLHYMPPANHVLITPHGVYTFTIRFQTTRFKVEGEKWTNYRASGPLGPLFLFLRQENIGKPFEDADLEAGKVQDIIDQALPDSGVEVHPVVVFVNERAILDLFGPALPVVYASPRKKPSVKSVLRDDRKSKTADEFDPLTDYEIQTIEDALMTGLSAGEKAAMLDIEVSA